MQGLFTDLAFEIEGHVMYSDLESLYKKLHKDKPVKNKSKEENPSSHAFRNSVI